MKRRMPILALLLCGMMTAGGCSLVRVNPERDAQVVLAQVGIESITKGEYNIQWNQWKQQLGITEDIENDSQYADTISFYKEYLLDSMVDEEVTRQQARKQGFYNFTAEQQAQMDSDFADIIASIRDSIEVQMATDDLSDEEIEAQVNEEMAAYREENGYTDEYIRGGLEDDMAKSLLYDEVTKDATADETALADKYNTLVTTDQDTYASDAEAYVKAYLNGTDIYYVPTGGIRMIQQILIKFSDEKVSEISSLRTAGDDEQADSVRDEALKELKDKADEVLQKLRDGSDFTDMIEQYNEDPGMESFPDGYPMASGVTAYADEFTQGGMALGKVGDISDLVASDYGYHILRFASQLGEGPVDFESVKDKVREAVLNTNKQSIWNDAMDQWKSAMEIKTYPKRID